MAGEIFDLVLEYGGAISSEHGDGRARSPFLERVFGPTVFQAFRELKAAFDPKNLLNPGNIVASPGVTQHMRYGTAYKTWEPKTLLDFSVQGGLRGGRRDVQWRRRVPQEARGDDVPLVHGHEGRRALDPRARQCPARRAVGQGARGRLRGQAALRGHGSLSRVQGLQVRMPVQRGHGEDEVRVPASLSPGERSAPAQPAVRQHRRAVPAGLGPRADLQLDRLVAAESAPDGEARRHRSAAAAARLRRGDLHRVVRPAQARARRAAGPGGALRRHVRHLQCAGGGPGGGGAAGSRGVRRPARPTRNAAAGR